jgi:hypothetical protein
LARIRHLRQRLAASSVVLLAPGPYPIRRGGSAFRHGAEDAGVTHELLSFGVGLFCRMGIGKSRDGHAGVVDAHDLRIWVEREIEGLGRRHLGDQPDIRDARAVAMTEVPTRRMFGEQRLDRLQTRAEPMLDPD